MAHKSQPGFRSQGRGERMVRNGCESMSAAATCQKRTGKKRQKMSGLRGSSGKARNEKIAPIIIGAGHASRALQEVGPHECLFPIGDPKSPDFHFCRSKTEALLPYCLAHMDLCYQPVPARRQDVQAAP